MFRVPYFLFFFFAVCSNANAIGFHDSADSLSTLGTEGFLRHFRFDEYIRDHDLRDIKLIESHRQYLEQLGLNGDFFIMRLYETYAVKTPFDFNDGKSFKPYLLFGETLLCSSQYMTDSIFVYKAAGDFLLNKFADSLETSIHDKEVDKDDFEIKYLLERLAENKYFIDLPKSNFVKIWEYAKAGRWDYIWHKLTSTYFKEFISAIAGASLFLMGAGWLFFKKRNKNKLGTNTNQI